MSVSNLKVLSRYYLFNLKSFGHQKFLHALHPFINPIIIIMVEIRLENKGIHGTGFIPFTAKYA